MMDENFKYRFWRAVEECLVKFHGKERSEALRKVLEFQRYLREVVPEGLLHDLVLHIEPFDLACDLAGEKKQLSDAEYREKYVQEILQRVT